MTRLLSTCALLCAAALSASAQPNFVIFFIDDMGYGDLGCYGSNVHRTPRIDRMAAEGMRFTSFYAQTVCGPSRGALMTGRYPERIGGGWLTRGDEVTLAETLRDAGYATAIIGKWDMSRRKPLEGVQPNDQGFDYFFGTLGANDSGRVTLRRNKTELDTTEDMGSLTGRYTDEAVAFLRKQTTEKPFFLYVAQTMVHVEIGASDAFRGKSPGDLYGDAIEELDWSAGVILDALAELGFDDNTYVLLTSDNGPWSQPPRVARYIESHGGHIATGSAGPLRGAKGSSWEGGFRVPAILRAPGRTPAGRVSDAIVSTLDVHPTFANLAGAELPAGRVLDGVDQRELIFGRSRFGARDSFRYFVRGELQAVRRGEWKLVVPGEQQHGYVVQPTPPEPQLYNLLADISERNNLARKHPDVFDELMRMAAKAKEEAAAWVRASAGADN